MQFYAPFGELNRKRGRMRSLLYAALNCFVRNEPGIAPTAGVAPVRVRPASDVALVLIRDTEREPVDVDLPADGEMKNVFVAVVQESFRTNRFKVSEGPIVNGNRLDPMNGVLQNEEIAKVKNNFVRKHRV